MRCLTLVQADLLRGSYVDPGRSRTALSAYAATSLGALSVRTSIRRTHDSHLRTRISPALVGRTLASIIPTDVRTLVRQLTEQLATSTAHHVHGCCRRSCARRSTTATWRGTPRRARNRDRRGGRWCSR